ncbi:MAG: VanZ family protein [Lachnospiraceae bacterium]|nr:VanZ family protein [Lachnospiraceae bacterium]
MATKKKNKNQAIVWITLAVISFLITGALTFVFVVSERNGHIIGMESFLQAGILIGGVAFLGTCFLLAGTSRPKRPRAAMFAMGVLFAVYLVILAGLLFGGERNYYRWWSPEARYSLKPFATIQLYIDAYRNHSLRIRQVASNLIGNILLFMPMAWFVPFLFKGMRKWYIFLPFMLVLICFVEIAQYLSGRGSMDIDDVILNFPGVLIGFVFLWNPLMVKLWKKTNLIGKK